MKDTQPFRVVRDCCRIGAVMQLSSLKMEFLLTGGHLELVDVTTCLNFLPGGTICDTTVHNVDHLLDQGHRVA